MKIFVNDEKKEVKEGLFLSELISSLPNINQNGIALALNNNVINKKKWENTKLKSHDKIIIIRATKGG